MFIKGVGKALPPHVYNQRELTAEVEQMWRAKSEDRAADRLGQFHTAVQVGQRHLALPKERYRTLSSFSEANRAFIEVGTDLAQQALVAAADEAGIDVKDLDAIFFTTVTGLAVPTIDARLINRLGLKPSIKRIPLFGLGCVAGAAGIARLNDYLLAYPDQNAALVSVELCSLTLQAADVSVANFIATGLFGDGAAAVIGSGNKGSQRFRTNHRMPKILRSKSVFYYDSEDIMGWEIGEDGFKIVLNAKIPQIVREYLPHDIDSFLAESGLSRIDIKSWVCHPGGPKVLEAMQDALDVTQHDLQLTWNSLRDVGNLSSASVLFVLADTLKMRPGRPGEYGLLLAMGPGFCSEMVLFKW